MATEILRGGDFKFEITLSDAGVAFNLTGVVDIIVTVVGADGRRIDSYTKTGSTITVSDAVNGEFTFLLQSAETSDAPLGLIDIHGKIQITDADYDDSLLERPFVIKGEYKLVDSDVKDD